MFFSNKFCVQDPRCFEALFFTANVDMVPSCESADPEIRMKERLRPSKAILEMVRRVIKKIMDDFDQITHR